jgi:DNA-binding CsgD family transcriptional regulator
MKPDELATRLRAAHRFVDAAAVVCDFAARLGLQACAVMLHRESGPPFVVVDNVPYLSDEDRLVARDNWGMRDPYVCPVIGPNGGFGRIVYGSSAPLNAELERDLLMISTHLSVWCTERRIGAVPDVMPRDQLTPRQREIATLAALGKTNAEIAFELGLSLNTIKVRLKQAFDRLGVDNRTELANMLRSQSIPDDVPPGITHLATVTVTRVAT